jgi:hypothetical protein
MGLLLLDRGATAVISSQFDDSTAHSADDHGVRVCSPSQGFRLAPKPFRKKGSAAENLRYAESRKIGTIVLHKTELKVSHPCVCVCSSAGRRLAGQQQVVGGTCMAFPLEGRLKVCVHGCLCTYLCLLHE